SARLSVVVTMVTLPLAVTGWADLFDRLIGWRPGARRPLLAAAAVVTAVLAVSTSMYTMGRSQQVFDPDRADEPRFASSAELQMIRTVDLGPGRVLGSPFAGTPLLYSLRGQPVVFPVAWQVWSADQKNLMEHLDALGTPAGCSVRAALDVTYLYQDADPYEQANDYARLNRLQIPGAQVVAEAGTARILRLPTCCSEGGQPDTSPHSWPGTCTHPGTFLHINSPRCSPCRPLSVGVHAYDRDDAYLSPTPPRPSHHRGQIPSRSARAVGRPGGTAGVHRRRRCIRVPVVAGRHRPARRGRHHGRGSSGTGLVQSGRSLRGQ